MGGICPKRSLNLQYVLFGALYPRHLSSEPYSGLEERNGFPLGVAHSVFLLRSLRTVAYRNPSGFSCSGFNEPSQIVTLRVSPAPVLTNRRTFRQSSLAPLMLELHLPSHLWCSCSGTSQFVPNGAHAPVLWAVVFRWNIAPSGTHRLSPRGKGLGRCDRREREHHKVRFVDRREREHHKVRFVDRREREHHKVRFVDRRGRSLRRPKVFEWVSPSR